MFNILIALKSIREFFFVLINIFIIIISRQLHYSAVKTRILVFLWIRFISQNNNADIIAVRAEQHGIGTH